jgi:hypothetical protein
VVEEDGTSEALVLWQKTKLIAPDLLVADRWKKVQRGELLKAEAGDPRREYPQGRVGSTAVSASKPAATAASNAL